ncbi:hypothetical protein BDZ89DRAFT_1075011 [Hymenopellis radicata]|nr:hypothetical protein BDZ89DRAFT_1075011 [Hymenopellis radicata]
MAPHCSTCCCQSTQIPLDTPELPDAVKAHIISNEPPSTSDLRMLREYRLSIDPYLARLNTEIAALSDMQEQLQKELDLRKATLKHLLMGGDAFNREPDYTWFDVFDPEDSPWTVRRVCQKWRMATQHPHIWTGLRITRTGLGACPWSLFSVASVLEELVQHSERWQYARLAAWRARCSSFRDYSFFSKGDHNLCHYQARLRRYTRRCAQLNMFTLPNLQHLEAGQKYSNELSLSLPIISKFLHISRCPLLSLTIHNCELSIAVPGLQRLSININGLVIERGALNRASNELSRPRLVPNLQSFAFRSCLQDPWRFMDVSIVDMIYVRSGMESLSFTIHPQSQLPNLSDDDNAGFNVSIVKQAMEDSKGTVFI